MDDYITDPGRSNMIEQHSQMAWTLPDHHVGVRDYDPGPAPILAYWGSEKSTLNIHFRIIHGDTQLKTVRQHHRDRIAPCW